MKKMLVFTLIMISVCSCRNQIKRKILVRDSIVKFEIEGLSSDGSNLLVKYHNDTIQDATWIIYGESGQDWIYYKFLKNGTVEGYEKDFVFDASLKEMQPKQKMNLKRSLKYLLDTNGILITKIRDTNFYNSFPDFKKHVPLIITSLKALHELNKD